MYIMMGNDEAGTRKLCFDNAGVKEGNRWRYECFVQYWGYLWVDWLCEKDGDKSGFFIENIVQDFLMYNDFTESIIEKSNYVW